jgi:uncharacterized protein YkwD
MKKSIWLVSFLWFGISFLSQTWLVSQEKKGESEPGKPDISSIERGLYEAISLERTRHSLPPLRLSPGLSGLARKHSADMADRDRLSHDSSSGQSYSDRLVGGGFYFISGGENVVRSETFVAEFIHRSLMSSPEHRDNILTVAFNEVGIGAAAGREAGVYFMTQDFLRTAPLLTRQEAKDRILRNIGELRAGQGLPPFQTREEFDSAAQSLAQLRAQGDKNLPIPAALGATQVYFYISPSLDEMGGFSAELILGASEDGGIGIEFSRSDKYPGGAYFIALVLFPRNRFLALDARDRVEIVRKALNTHRRKEKLRDLEWANELADKAEKTAVLFDARGRPAISPFPARKERIIFSYWTADLEQVPREIRARISGSEYTRVGLRIIFSRTKEYRGGAFRVSGVVE